MSKLPKIINQEDFEIIFRNALKLKTENKKQYRLALLLGFEAGMRISEIVGLKAFECKSCKSSVMPSRIEGKRVWTCDACKRELTPSEMRRTPSERWEIEPLMPADVSDTFIRVKKGKGGKERIVPRPKRMTDSAKALLPLKLKRRTIQKVIEELSEKYLDKKISFHTLRHGFCSHLANSGRPLHEIQMLAGHSRLDTTGIYLHANPEKTIKETIDAF